MQRPAVCDFLHGPMTSPHAIAALREALIAGAEKHFEILYYRKDGEFFFSFKNLEYEKILSNCFFKHKKMLFSF